jgi:DNA adenine methylase
MDVLKSPFPYFGGKSRVADLVWDRLGDVDNYVEPFAGSLAVLLRRPQAGKIETVNYANHYIVNFWRAVQADPAAVAAHCDHAVTEADLHARHRYLVLGDVAAEFRKRVETDPEFYDARCAGWWVWGQCCWIGGGWCDAEHRNVLNDPRPNFGPDGMGNGINRPSSADQQRVPALSQHGKGITATANLSPQLPDLSGDSGATGRGVCAKVPRLDSRGEGSGLPGVHAEAALSAGRPQLGDAFDIGRGVNGNQQARYCDIRTAWLVDWMARLRDRLRLVRDCYGHWARICDSKTTMTRLGVTGAFLDPPYAKHLDRLAAWIRFLLGEGPEPEAYDAGREAGSNRSGGLYSGDSTQDIDRLVAEVHVWCRRWGGSVADPRPKVRIALCGYEGEHDALEELGWTVEAWTAHGGYANRNEDNQNKGRERIWFSPACLSRAEASGQGELFL